MTPATPHTTNPPQRAHPAVLRAALRSRRRTSYSYDPLANRITGSNASTGSAQGPSNYSYNANNQLTQAGAVSYTYDTNGNTLSQTDAGNATNTRSYVYDTDNRLIEVHDAANAIIATYRYDPFGRRLSKTLSNTIGQGSSTYYFYSAEGLIAEADANGQIIQSYGYAPGSTFTTNPLWTKLSTAGTATYYTYQNDHLGTPQKLLNQSGLTVWSATYDAFGRATVDPASTITNNLRFPGQYADQETGLHYNWMQFYDPTRGRYVTSDPIGLVGGMNIFTYVGGNSTSGIDPYGLWLEGLVGKAKSWWKPIKEVVCGVVDATNKANDWGQNARIEDEFLKYELILEMISNTQKSETLLCISSVRLKIEQI